MKSSGLYKYVVGSFMVKLQIDITTDTQKKVELNAIDHHITDLTNRIITEKIARAVPSIIEAVKMDLNEDKEHLDNQG